MNCDETYGHDSRLPNNVLTFCRSNEKMPQNYVHDINPQWQNNEWRYHSAVFFNDDQHSTIFATALFYYCRHGISNPIQLNFNIGNHLYVHNMLNMYDICTQVSDLVGMNHERVCDFSCWVVISWNCEASSRCPREKDGNLQKSCFAVVKKTSKLLLPLKKIGLCYLYLLLYY